jgi:hypothetical protein
MACERSVLDCERGNEIFVVPGVGPYMNNRVFASPSKIHWSRDRCRIFILGSAVKPRMRALASSLRK